MADAEALRKEVAELDAELLAVDDAIKTAEQEIKTASDRKERLSGVEAEVAAVEQRSGELRDYVAAAQRVLADFPTETQVLKLERRVESLKEALSDSNRVIAQHRTGVEAYEQRRQECATARKQILQELGEHARALDARVHPLVAADEAVPSAERILDACEALAAIAGEREDELAALNTRIEELLADDAALMQRTQQAKGLVARELPRIDAEKDRDVAEIKAEFTKERDQLQAVYDKLFAVNKEQQYHLARGTHIKRVPVAQTEAEEAALSSQHARTAASVVEMHAKLADVVEELTYSKKQAEQLRKKGRAAHVQFESEKEGALQRLQVSREKLDDANSEAASLRNLKAELYHQLQNVRESPAAATTPRRAAAPRQIAAS